VKPFVPGDRFAAWRKRNVRVAKNAERRAMGRGGKKGSKK
jgi:large subunit ribosomal protein L27